MRWIPWVVLIIAGAAWVPILSEQSKPGASPQQALAPETYLELSGPAEIARELMAVRRAQVAADADRQKLMAQLYDLQRLMQKVDDQQETIKELKTLLSAPLAPEQLADQKLDQRIKVLEDSRDAVISGMTKLAWLIIAGMVTYTANEIRKYRLMKNEADLRHADVAETIKTAQAFKDQVADVHNDVNRRMQDLIDGSISLARREGYEEGKRQASIEPTDVPE